MGLTDLVDDEKNTKIEASQSSLTDIDATSESSSDVEVTEDDGSFLSEYNQYGEYVGQLPPRTTHRKYYDADETLDEQEGWYHVEELIKRVYVGEGLQKAKLDKKTHPEVVEMGATTAGSKIWECPKCETQANTMARQRAHKCEECESILIDDNWWKYDEQLPQQTNTL